MADKAVIERFLRKVDHSFPVPLSEKQPLDVLTEKFLTKATLCAEYVNGEIVSLVAGYTDRLSSNMAYISVAATLPEYRGKGMAGKLLREFISICREKAIFAVHLYAVRSNIAAVSMYLAEGFEEWHCENEPRPDDMHLIYYIRKDPEQ